MPDMDRQLNIIVVMFICVCGGWNGCKVVVDVVLMLERCGGGLVLVLGETAAIESENTLGATCEIDVEKLA